MFQRSAFGVIHKALSLPKGAVFHGTTASAAKGIRRTGLRGQVGTYGEGAYLTPDKPTASAYALKPSPWSKGTKPADWQDGTYMGPDRRKGKLMVFKPKGKPVNVVPKAGTNPEIDVFKPGDVGKPVHVQNVKRTSVDRSVRRTLGIKSDYEEMVASKPKSLTDPKERERRLAAHRAKKKAASWTNDDFL